MATKAQLEARIAKKLLSKKLREVTWSDLIGVLDGLSPADKATILVAVRSTKPPRIGKVILAAIVLWARAAAETEAGVILSDDSVSLTELVRFL